MNDKKLVQGLLLKDEKCFNIIYFRYVKLIYHIIYSMTCNKHDSEDLVQETFIQMYNSIHTYSMKNSFKFWLITIAKNKTFDYLRKRKNVLDEVFVYSVPDECVVDKSDFYDIINEYKAVINKEEYDIITLHLFHKLKFKEIALIYDKTVSSVNNIYSRGIAKIKGEIKNEKN